MYTRLFRSALIIMTVFVVSTASTVFSAPTCPLSYGSTDSAKSHKLYLYFPTAADNTFPNYAAGVSPAEAFDVADLDPIIGTTDQLRDRIFDVVVDDFCEFNIQVLQTLTNPSSLPAPPARRSTVAVGTDSNGAWGRAQSVDIGDNVNVDFARVWAGTFTTCEGAAPGGGGGCSMMGSLTGANATLDRWANAIGGTAAHEAGHTYGLAHTDDNPPDDLGGQPGPAPTLGEDGFHRHLMPAGYNLTGEDRASYRRHISNRTFGILATNVGLSVQTMHNWDLVNPNAASAYSLTMDFLSTQPSMNITWSFAGSSSPWINPTVTGPLGATVFKGTMYNRYRITWSSPNPSWSGGAPGVLPGGAQFHIGATFTGVDFNQPDPIIIQDLTLRGAGSSPLPLHPRLPMYDTGTIDGIDGTFGINFFPPEDGRPPLRISNSVVYHLPRLASIESMTGHGTPFTFSGEPITPWNKFSCDCNGITTGNNARCNIASIADPPNVLIRHSLGEPGVIDCNRGVSRLRPNEPPTDGGGEGGDSPFIPDNHEPICAGMVRDPFPSAVVYIVATFIDENVRHYDPIKRQYVTGPVASKLYYQFAGVRNLREIENAGPCRENNTCF